MRAVMMVLGLAAVIACDGGAEGDERRRASEGEGEGEGEGEDVFGDGGVGDDCAENADCGEGTRCGCDDGLCACEEGIRGDGENGVDVCVDENDCQSALCVEGNGDFFCSAVCVDDDDCGPALPICADIAFVGRICIRDLQG